MKKASLIVPVERPSRSRKKVNQHFENKAVIINQMVFNTDVYNNGAAIKMTYHTGETANGIIAESTKDFLKVYIVNKFGICQIREIYLEEYISGTWGIKLL